MLQKGVLYRSVTPFQEDKNALQQVIPQSYQKKALQGCHDDIRHMGLEQMLDLLQDQLYWPGMTKDVDLHIVRCDRCIQFNRKSQKVVKENIWAIHPLQLVHLIYIMVKVTEGGKQVHILVITDHFMRYPQMGKTGKCTTQALWYQSVVHYGLWETIISDQGQKFESDLRTVQVGKSKEIAY